ncbi:hypothetical protein PsYK624_138340 [Phanerochaete sordida]|uniref:Suppressor of forked domain-containing protein n=1 Tax=Phanerochaete sordida TaxID=48140 RepID=A0A9P3GME1_9APHY|nr:hypothetical protein PsYK624_138340 [Phanerochaete sordida]
MSQKSQANTSSSQTQSSEYEVLQAEVRENPRDVDAWLKLVDVAKESKDFERINQTYEALLEAFQNSSSAQIPYIRHILQSSSPTRSRERAGSVEPEQVFGPKRLSDNQKLES